MVNMIAYDLSDVGLRPDRKIRVLFGSNTAAEAYASLLETYDVPFTQINKRKIVMTRENYDTFLVRNQFRSLSGAQTW